MTAHAGSCHCGAVNFQWTGDVSPAMACNCSICRRKGYLLVFGPIEALEVASGREALTIYNFNKGAIDHQFCRTCGCAPFGEGTGPDGSRMAAVNVRCLTDVDLDALEITKFDGASL